VSFNMKKINLFAPQWQGSGKTKELFKGAYAFLQYCRTLRAFDLIEIPIFDSTDLIIENNIFGYSALYKQLKNIREAIELEMPDKILTIGGGCGVEVPIISYFGNRYDSFDIFWFDAHGDLNTPESSSSKHFHGMPLRFLVDEIKNNPISRFFSRIPINNITLIGTRDLDDEEIDFISKNQLKVISSKTNWDDIETNLSKILQTDNKKTYLHIDLDVLDPKYYKNVKCPSMNGMTIEQLIHIIKQIISERQIIGISLLENTETDHKNIKKIDELIKIGFDF